MEADGRLDSTHPWQNNNDRVAYQRLYDTPDSDKQKMAVALMCADPNTPEDVIREQLSIQTMPPRTGYDRTQPGIMDALASNAPVEHSLTDYTGRQASQGI